MNIFSMTRQSLIVAVLILSTSVAYSQQVEQDSVKTADTKKAEGEEAKDEKEGLRERQRKQWTKYYTCLLYTSPSPRDATLSRMPSSA